MGEFRHGFSRKQVKAPKRVEIAAENATRRRDSRPAASVSAKTFGWIRKGWLEGASFNEGKG